jgi:hypothetical protein
MRENISGLRPLVNHNTRNKARLKRRAEQVWAACQPSRHALSITMASSFIRATRDNCMSGSDLNDAGLSPPRILSYLIHKVSKSGLTAMGDLSALNHGAPGDTVVQTPRATSLAPTDSHPHIGSGSAQIGRSTGADLRRGRGSVLVTLGYRVWIRARLQGSFNDFKLTLAGGEHKAGDAPMRHRAVMSAPLLSKVRT